LRDDQITVCEYWDGTYPTHLTCRLSEQAIIEQLQELLKEAVRRRLISDVPLGAFLRGGVDSTAIVDCMARITQQPMKTFDWCC
jgi:asparagine synthase (glutamine-hydrolysing)